MCSVGQPQADRHPLWTFPSGCFQLELHNEPHYRGHCDVHLHSGLLWVVQDYCYNIMKQHHGDVELSSTEGKGTVVRLNFPKGVGKGVGIRKPLTRPVLSYPMMAGNTKVSPSSYRKWAVSPIGKATGRLGLLKCLIRR